MYSMLFLEILFPLINNNLIDYLLGKIIYIVFNKNYFGLTNREGFGIFNTKEINDGKSIGLSYEDI